MAALFTLLLVGCGLILSWLLYDFGRQNFIRETEAAIDSEIAGILSDASTLTQQERVLLIEIKSLQPHPYYFYHDSNGTKLAGNLAQAPTTVERIAEGVIGFRVDEQKLAAKIHTFPDGSRLMVARNINDIIASHNRLKWLSMLMLILMLTVILVSFLISYFVVSRINRIGNIAGQIIETGDLSRRVPIDSNWDDLSSLGEALNILLTKIEELMQGIRDVADNIAHDLRTPLTRIHNQLEELKDKPVKKQHTAQLLTEVDGLLSTFNALLRIANIEKGNRYQNFTKVKIDTILQDVIELYEPVAEEKDIHIVTDLSGDLIIDGDSDLLFQLFANLVDNAIKFSPHNSEITISTASENNTPSISIADNGIGIQAEEREKVFNRFYRSDKSRHEAGSGLGLSLVHAVLQLHKGKIELQNNQPGLKVVVSL